MFKKKKAVAAILQRKHEEMYSISIWFLSHYKVSSYQTFQSRMTKTYAISTTLQECVASEIGVRVCSSVLTAAQHSDAWSHIQIPFEQVAGSRAHTAAQQQKPQHRGWSSLHLSWASHGMNTRICTHAKTLTQTYSPCNTHTPPANAHTHKHKHTHALWQTLAGNQAASFTEPWRGLKKPEKIKTQNQQC